MAEKRQNKIWKLLIVSGIICIVLLGWKMNTNASTTGWVKDGTGWKYVGENGQYVSNQWIHYCDEWYWIDENQYMTVGWKDIYSHTYYFEESGVMVRGFQSINNRLYYFYDGGDLYTDTGWKQITGNQNWYYFGNDHFAYVGWQKINNEWYYMNQDGIWIDNNSYEQGSIKGIDVSRWQQEIDWDQVKGDGISFSFIRIGHGERNLDSNFVRNIEGANRVGIPAGVYFYSTAQTTKDAILDAQFVIDSMKGYNISYPVAVDLEDSSQISLGKDKITQIAKAFCDEIADAGYTPMVYCNEDWYRHYIDFSQLSGVEKWIARYSVRYDTSIERAIWQSGSTCYIDGIEGPVDSDFAFVDFSQKISPRNCASSTYVKATGEWIQNNAGRWYHYFDGGYPASKWEKIKGKYYLFDEEGYLEYGWKYIGNDWYYLTNDGSCAIGWAKISGAWYYMNGSGVMQTGWVKTGGTWYYLNGSGAMQTGWIKTGGTWYYLNGSGAMQTGWIKLGDTWYYLNGSGAMQTGWVKTGNVWYYLDESGAMQTGWVKTGNTWYYLDKSGEMQTGWVKYGNAWYYLESSGAMAVSKWVDGGRYYVDANGQWVN